MSASKVLTRDDLEEESQAENCKFLLKYAETLGRFAKRKMMFGAEDKQNIGISLHPFCSWLFFWVAMPCAGLSLKTHCMSSAKPMNINGELMVIDAGSTWNGFQSSCVWGNVRIRLDAIPWTFWAFSNVCVVLKWKEVCLSKLRHLQTTYFETHSWGTPRRQLNHKSQESRGAVKLFFLSTRDQSS